MTPISKCVISGLAAFAGTVVAVSAVERLAARPQPVLQHQVDRAHKGDRLPESPAAVQRTIKYKTQPSAGSGDSKLLDGCEPMFSPVTLPSMAHVPGRCVG